MAKRLYLSAKVRFEVLARDGFRCRYCGRHSSLVALVVDHVFPVVLGGTNSKDNLAAACEECNQGKGRTSPAEINSQLDHNAQVTILSEALREAVAHMDRVDAANVR